MKDPKPLNKALIAFTLAATIVGGTFSKYSPPSPLSAGEALTTGLIGVALSPIFIAWTRALWNTLLPRITGWREINFWEAAGIAAMAFFLIV